MLGAILNNKITNKKHKNANQKDTRFIVWEPKQEDSVALYDFS